MAAPPLLAFFDAPPAAAALPEEAALRLRLDMVVVRGVPPEAGKYGLASVNRSSTKHVERAGERKGDVLFSTAK